MTGAPLVTVSSCQVVSGAFLPLTDEVGVAVRFRNDSPQVLRSIVWRAKYDNYSFDVVDDGTFTPGVRIDNFLLVEQGSSHVDIGGLLSDLLAAAYKVRGTANVVTSNLKLPDYIGTEDPENCSIVRATSADGGVWINPALSQQAAPLRAQMQTPAPSTSPSSSPDPTTRPIDVRKCVLSLFGKAYLQVSFRNETQRAIDRVVFRAPYGTGAIDFVDQGSYAGGVWIDHRVKTALPDDQRTRQFTSLDDPSRCVAVKLQFADGTTWEDPNLNTASATMPTPVPDAIVLTTKTPWSRRHAGNPTPAPSASASAQPAKI